MKSYSNIFFLRHLKTLNNSMHIISGQSDSEIIQLDYLAEHLSGFDKIYCSPSLRCIKTLELLGNNSISADDIVYDERLLERNMGSLEGLLKTEGQKKYPELFMSETFNIFQTPPQGESYESFKERVNSFYNEILDTDERLNILVCSHNQTLKLLRLLVLGKDVTYQSWSEYSFKNGELKEVKKNCS